jgi:AcrR family transcriptional regulator
MSNERMPTVRKERAGAPARPDRRIVRTERALGAALVDLMHARDFRQISVRQVLERARVGRATFYAHYRGKQDLLLSETERFWTVMEANFLRREGSAGRRLAPLAELLAHVADYDRFQRAIDRSGVREDVYGLLAAHVARTIERRLAALRPEVGAGTLPRAATARLLAAAFMELVRWWLERDARPSAAEMDARFHDIAWRGVAANG